MRVRVVTCLIVASIALGGSFAFLIRHVELLLIPTLGFLILMVLAFFWVVMTDAAVPSGVERPLDTRPADGLVDIAAMSEVESTPNSVDPRWRRFVSDRGGPATPSRLDPRPVMLGRVVWVSVFVGKDGRSWTDQEIARGHDSVLVAATWLERQAARLGAPLNIEVAETYFVIDDQDREPVEVGFAPEGDGFGPMEANATQRYLAAASLAALVFGFRDVSAMMEKINAKVEGDAHAWIFHQKSKGRSIAIDGKEFGLDGVGLAVCFARESSFPEPLLGSARVDPTTVIHEVLHLFGASDKYGVPLRTFAPGSVPSLDIMRLGDDRLSRLTIGRLTAWELGWPVTLDEKTAATR